MVEQELHGRHVIVMCLSEHVGCFLINQWDWTYNNPILAGIGMRVMRISARFQATLALNYKLGTAVMYFCISIYIQ